MTPPTLRPARLSDAAALAKVHVATWQQAYRGLLPDDFLDSLSLQASVDRWQQKLAQSAREVWVACEAERIVGFVSFGASRDGDAAPAGTGEVYSLYVHPTAWRRGIGSALMEQALHNLRALGYVEATLWVLRANQQARAFYEARGFAVDGAAKVDVNAVGIAYDDVRYRLYLIDDRGTSS
jgi:ribosomal protein S18 acetylase RimI-like enzyme